MYKLRYYTSFKDINEDTIKVEVYINTTSNISAEELYSSAEAVRVEYSCDDIFQPLKLSGASINFLVKNVLKDLYTGVLVNIRVHIYKNDSLFWVGFQTPNMYSQNYNNEYEELTIECVDTLSICENIKYKYFKTDDKVATFYDIITHILDHCDAEKIIPNLYIHNSISYDSSYDIISRFSIQERNFFDEEEEPQNVREILGDIMRYLGMTLFQYKDSYYAVDYNSLKYGNKSFTRYNRNDGTSSIVTLDIPVRNLMNIGIGESNASISLGDVYNKVSVIANTNTMETVIPDAVEDEEDIINQNVDPNKIWEKQEIIDDDWNNSKDEKKDYTVLNGYFKSKANWYYVIPSGWKGETYLDGRETYVEVTNDNIDKIDFGVFWQKYTDYLTEEEPSSLSWGNCLTFAMDGGYNYLDFYYPELLSLNTRPTMMLKGGYMIIDMTYRMSIYNRANTIYKSWARNDYEKRWEMETFSNTGYGTGFEDTRIPCHLQIGDYYFDGDEWVSYDDYNAKVARGYYKDVDGPTVGWDGAMWYKQKNSYGEWEYMNKAAYEASTNSTKVSGSCGNGRKYFIRDASTQDGRYDEDTIWIEESYFQECCLRDNFYLVHKNEEGDQVFDVEKQLTNTVSWRLKLLDSEDGVAIKLPEDKTLYGELIFKLFCPNHLGRAPMVRNDFTYNVCKAWHITDLKLIYTSSNAVENIYTGKEYEADVVYSNDINELYVTEFDDVTLRVNSHNPKAVSSYSYVFDLVKKDFISNNVYNVARKKNAKPEEHLISKYIDHYSTPRFQYENTLLNKDITPFSLIHEETLNKDLAVSSITYDLCMGNAEVQLIEL